MRIILDLFILPLEFLMEFLFEAMNRLLGSVPMALFFLSLFVSLFTLPLYLNAERVQRQEKEKRQSMDHHIRHIKKSFTGDERLLILSYYQRLMGYSSISALKGIIPLLLQIPFFLAAYHCLSGSELLKNTETALLGNLGEADKLLNIGNISIHLLPILMTIINCISGVLYTKKGGVTEKIQVFLPAVIFLALLYSMPAGLVLYWIFNNLFSMVKNIYMDLDESKRKKALLFPAGIGIMYYLWGISSGRFLGYVFSGNIAHAVLFFALGLIFVIPVLNVKIGRNVCVNRAHTDTKIGDLILPAIISSVIMGAVVPLKLIAASPIEFVNIFDYVSPYLYVMNCICVSAGTFLVWGCIVWFLSGQTGRRRMIIVFESLALVFLADYFVFGAVEGKVNASLVFDDIPRYELWQQILNILILIGIIVVVIVIRSVKIKRTVFMITVVAVMLTTIIDCVKISKELCDLPVKEEGEETLGILPISRNGRNVIVLMLDRAVSAYVPYIFAEKPELKEAFDGFTWYPNTVSHGGYTIFGMPSLFGGYEYTPAAMNGKPDKSVAEDLDEALKVMPIDFGESGWKVTVCDPTYAGFSELPDISIYDDMPYVKAYRLWGRYSAGDGNIGKVNELTARNFVFYSIMEVMPQSFRKGIYDNGHYLNNQKIGNVDGAFLDSYREMDALPEMSVICDEGDSFILLTNNITHSPQLLKKPEYEPTDSIIKKESTHTAGNMLLDTSMHLGEEQYDVNMAAFIKLAEWFDMMRKEDVFDNSRIILVSDHGNGLGQFEELIVNEELDVEGYNPLLMVKDFDSKGFVISDGFMTNADTPALAMEGVISDPVNPFSGKVIDMSGKYPFAYITLSDKLSLGNNKGNIMDTEEDPWYRVHDNIFEKANWEKIR